MIDSLRCGRCDTAPCTSRWRDDVGVNGKRRADTVGSCDVMERVNLYRAFRNTVNKNIRDVISRCRRNSERNRIIMINRLRCGRCDTAACTSCRGDEVRHRRLIRAHIHHAVKNARVAVQIGGCADCVIVTCINGWGSRLQPIIAGCGRGSRSGDRGGKQRVAGNDAASVSDCKGSSTCNMRAAAMN